MEIWSGEWFQLAVQSTFFQLEEHQQRIGHSFSMQHELFSLWPKKREGKIEVERNDGLRVPWGGQKSDQLSDERWAGTAGHSDMGSDPRIQLVEECVHAKLLQSCPTLCNTMDCSPPGSSVRGILQARKLEWIAVSYSRGSSQPRDRTHVSYISCIGKQILYH